MIAEEFRKKQHFSATSEIKLILDLEKKCSPRNFEYGEKAFYVIIKLWLV